MTQLTIIFGLRMLSAILLLVFLGLIAWLAYQDIRATAALGQQGEQHYGYLRVVGADSGDPVPGTLFPLLPVTTIGRAQGSTIMLEDSYVSSEHAIVAFRANHWWLEDLESRNGTQLNDVPLTDAVVLGAGDIIAIGGIRLKVEPIVITEALNSEEDVNSNDDS